MIVVKARLGIGIVRPMYPHQTVRAPREDRPWLSVLLID